ncbi:unnamed protein product [Lactuca virosa]|uniref:Uncharacterized protein n=1 Tax=Lactuca virosa TaxID=75947 RepID=A0AAU9PNU7_9ASTR|nr:unnamed protein product [Lactuca virosa]
MRTSFPSAHSLFTRFSKQRRKGGQQVPQALCPTHLSRSKCSSPVPPNAPICRQRSCECAVMLRMLRHRIDRPSSRSFPVHSLYLSNTQGRTWWEGRSPSLCLADHSAGISHSRPRLTAARGCSCKKYRFTHEGGLGNYLSSSKKNYAMPPIPREQKSCLVIPRLQHVRL